MPKRGESEREEPDADDAENPSGDDRCAHACERGDDARLEVPEERAARVADLLDAGEPPAQAVRDRLVPERPAEDAAEPAPAQPKNFVKRWFVARSGG